LSEAYQRDFRGYEAARRRYMESLEDFREILARFTGAPEAQESDIRLIDIARLEGMRVERDLAYADFIRLEAEICRQLIARLIPESLNPND